jgi:hypothetical protein
VSPSILSHRRTRLPYLLLTLALVLLAASPSPAHAADQRLLVKFRPAVSSAHAGKALAAVGARQLDAIGAIGVRVVSVPRSAAERARAALAHNPSVAFVEPDAIAEPQESIPNDPYFPQGPLALGSGAWGWYTTHTTQAWDVTQGDPSITIAILDTGLKGVGLDFDGQLLPGWNVLNGTSDTTSGAGNHGTYVAGVAGLAANNASGNAGYCPKCKIMPVQVGTDSGAAYSDMASGLTWVADHGARIANLSWGGTTASSTLASAVAYARSKDVVVFASAGNSNCDCPTYPAATPGVLGIGGATAAGAKVADSNYGSWVSLAAPEGNMTAWPTASGGGYAEIGGTSLAAPAAAGIAGLVLSAKPGLTGAAVEQALMSSATPVSFTTAHGRVDAMAALGGLGFADPQLPGSPVNTIAPQILLETNGDFANVPLAGAPAVGQSLVRSQGAWTGSSPLALSAIAWDRCNTDGANCTLVGSTYSYEVQSADTGYALRIRVTFTDPQGVTTATSALTAPVGGAPAPTAAPANIAPASISGTPRNGQVLSASAGTWSNSPTAYSYEWRRCDSAGAGCSAVPGAGSSSYTLGSADVGSTIRVAVTATNSGGSETSISAATGLVQAAAQTLTFSGSLSKSSSTQSYSLSAGDGASHAALSFNTAKCGQLSLTLRSTATGNLASVTGPSVLALDRTLTRGAYVYAVSGAQPKGCTFTLAVSTAAP